MYSEHLPAQMSLISAATGGDGYAMAHQHQLGLVASDGAAERACSQSSVLLAPGFSNHSDTSYNTSNNYNSHQLIDFSLDEAFNFDFLLQNRHQNNASSHYHNNQNQNQSHTQQQPRESDVGCFLNSSLGTSQTDASLVAVENENTKPSLHQAAGGQHEVDNNSSELLLENVFDGIDLDELLNGAPTPEAAVIQSPSSSSMALAWPNEDEDFADLFQLAQGVLEPSFVKLLVGDELMAAESLHTSSVLDQVNSPSAEVSYANLIPPPQPSSASFVDDEASSSSYLMTSASSLPSVAASSTSGLEDMEESDDEQDSSCSEQSTSGKKRTGSERIKSAGGSVSKSSYNKKSKKESNKAAAERYRSKKQSEKQELFSECLLHEQKNRELKSEIEEVQAELNFIKNLLVEALLTKSQNAKN